MATYNKELARKIIRLLESDHDGEVAAAVRKLRGMAKERGQNLDELMAAIYGSTAPKASSGSSPWDASEMMRRAQERAEAARPKQRRFSDEKLQELREAYGYWGSLVLTAWETTFVEDILDRGMDCDPSDKQTAVIDKILAKFKSFAARNGDEKSFWGA